MMSCSSTPQSYSMSQDSSTPSDHRHTRNCESTWRARSLCQKHGTPRRFLTSNLTPWTQQIQCGGHLGRFDSSCISRRQVQNLDIVSTFFQSNQLFCHEHSTSCYTLHPSSMGYNAVCNHPRNSQSNPMQKMNIRELLGVILATIVLTIFVSIFICTV